MFCPFGIHMFTFSDEMLFGEDQASIWQCQISDATSKQRPSQMTRHYIKRFHLRHLHEENEGHIVAREPREAPQWTQRVQV